MRTATTEAAQQRRREHGVVQAQLLMREAYE